MTQPASHPASGGLAPNPAAGVRLARPASTPLPVPCSPAPRPAFPAALITPQLPLYGTPKRSPIPTHTSQLPHPENCCEMPAVIDVGFTIVYNMSAEVGTPPRLCGAHVWLSLL